MKIYWKKGLSGILVFIMIVSMFAGMPLQVHASPSIAWEQMDGSTTNLSTSAGAPTLYVYEGVPYVAYGDGNNGNEGTLMKYNGTDWETVGGSFSGGGIGYTSLYVYDGTPYVAFEDYNVGTLISVMKYTDGSGWQQLGNLEASDGNCGAPSLYVYNGIPYVAFMDIDESSGEDTIVIKMYDEDTDTWTKLGDFVTRNGLESFPSLYVYDGVPYIAFGLVRLLLSQNVKVVCIQKEEKSCQVIIANIQMKLEKEQHDI